MSDHDEHREGLHHDLPALFGRRQALRMMAGAGAGLLAAAPTAWAKTPTAVVPTETAGPYPADGSNGPDVLDDTGIVRTDIRSSFGGAAGRATGVRLRINLTVTDASKDYKAMRGCAVYLWHCDRLGRYSLYSNGITDQNYLRGIGKANSSGTVSFLSIFPACYDGRWPHIHFEVYSSVAKATSNGPIVKTSQIALPAATCRKVYATGTYPSSAANLRRVSLSSDNVFGNDRAIHQLATMTGSVRNGFTANLTIGV